jgi:hypothetical protein
MPLSPERLAQLLQSIAAFNAALKIQLGLKLGKTERAADSSLFEGKTLAQVKAEITSATDAEIDALETILNAFIARRDNPHQVTKAQVGLDKVENYAPATDAEAVTATGVDRYLVPANLAAFWASKVGAAPETLDTIAEIAAALQNNPDVINQLLTSVGNKLDKTGVAADSSKLEGKTLAEILDAATGGVDLSEVVKKTDDFAGYSVGAQTFAQIFAGIQDDLDAVEALIPAKATAEEVEAGTDDAKFVTAAGVKAGVAQAVNALVDGAPEALDTLKELADKLADQDDAVAAIVSSLADKLGKLETAADSAKFGGKTLAQFIADADVATKAITDPLAARITALEEATGGGSGFLTETSDLGNNPVVVTEGAEPQALKDILSGHNTSIEAVDAAVQLAGDAAEVADGKAVAAQATADAAKATADAALPATGTAVDSSKLEGQTLEQILATIRGGDVQTIQAVQDALDAYIAQAEAGGLEKATSAEAIAGTDDAKYITALALKAKVDDAISALVDGAPTALDTLKELADKLTQEGDALAALITAVDDKLGKTEQAADSALLGGKSFADVTASQAEVTAGTEAAKFVTPATLKPELDALALSMESGDTALQGLVDSLTAAFNDAATEIEGETPPAV